MYIKEKRSYHRKATPQRTINSIQLETHENNQLTDCLSTSEILGAFILIMFVLLSPAALALYLH